MAGPSIAVRVIGDLSNFAKSMGDTATHGESAASRLRSGFTGAISAFNQTGVMGPLGDALGGVQTAIDNVVGHAKGIGPAFMGAGAAIAGVGAGVSALGSKDQAAHQQLQAAVEATGKSYDDYADQVDQAVKHQEKFGDSASETQDALRILTQATGDPAKALQLLGETTDLAAAKHISLDDAATKLGKTYNGNTKLLKEYGISADSAKKANEDLQKATDAVQKAQDAHAKAVQKLGDVQAELRGKTTLTAAEQIRLRDAQAEVMKTQGTLEDATRTQAAAQDYATQASGKQGDAVALLADKIKGQGSAQADTFAGKLRGLKATVEDNVAAFGEKYGPALTTAGTAMAGFGAAVEIGKGVISGLGNVTKIGTGIQAAFNAVMDANPIMLVVIGIGLLVAGFVLLYTKVGWFHDLINGLFNWIKDHWPLLVAILLGPFGVVLDLIIKNFGTIKQVVLDAWTNVLQPVFNALATAFMWVANAVQWAWNNILKPVWDVFIAVVSWLWNAVLKPAFDGIALDFKDLATGVKWVWDNILKPVWDTFINVVSWLWDNVLKPDFDLIKSVFADVGNALKWVWDNVIKPVWDAFRTTVDWLWNNVLKPDFDLIKSVFTDVGNGLKWAWDNIVKPVWDAFKQAVDDVKGAIDSVGGAISKIPGLSTVTGFIGKHLQHGGIVTQPTVALIGEAGPEAVIPLDRVGKTAIPAGGTGPVVNIEQANFAQAMDVDLFMKRVAWHAQTRTA